MNERDRILFASPNDELAWIAYADLMEEDGMRTDADFMRNVLQRKNYPIKASPNPNEVIRSMLSSGFRPLWPHVDLVNDTVFSPLDMTPRAVASRVRMILIPPGRFPLRMYGGINSCAETVGATMESFWLAETLLTSYQLVKLLSKQPSKVLRIIRDGFRRVAGRSDPLVNENFRRRLHLPLCCPLPVWNEVHREIEDSGYWAQTGLPSVDFSIPHEAQWEYACRAGGTTDFSIGGIETEEARDLIGSRFIRDDNSRLECRNVGEKVPNAFGIYDMQAYHRQLCRRDVDSARLLLKGGDVNDRLSSCRPESRIIVGIGTYAATRLMATTEELAAKTWFEDPPNMGTLLTSGDST